MPVHQLPVITLDPEVDSWDRQPSETAYRFAQFAGYRDLGRGRTLRKVAESLTRSAGYIRQVAAAYRWVERAEAWDLHRDKLHERVWLEQRRQAAERDGVLLDAAIGKVAQRLRTILPEDLDPADMIRMLDVVLRHRRVLFGDPQETIAVTGPGGDPLTLHLAEFSGMSSNDRRRTIMDLTDAVRRRAEAAAGGDDDEPDDPG